ncbi:MAG: glycosyltransferase [Phormidesmis sp.]
MTYDISVVICSHNPCLKNLARVLNALKKQTLPAKQWELLLIDNASEHPLASYVDLSWHPGGRHVYEEKLGLTNARLCAFNESQSSILAFVDDDNLLDADFLCNLLKISAQYPKVGAFGGKVIPEFETKPEEWIRKFDNTLAIRDFGNHSLYCEELNVSKFPLEYPAYAPIGAGLVLRKRAAKAYAKSVLTQPNRLSFGRSGKQLTSGEDNDIILTVLSEGWGIGYFPQLRLTHLISANRLTRDYLAKLNYASSRSWVQVLNIHGIRPWHEIPSWGVFPRKMKAFLSYQPWKSDEAYVRWKGACGLFEGLSTLSAS